MELRRDVGNGSALSQRWGEVQRIAAEEDETYRARTSGQRKQSLKLDDSCCYWADHRPLLRRSGLLSLGEETLYVVPAAW